MMTKPISEDHSKHCIMELEKEWFEFVKIIVMLFCYGPYFQNTTDMVARPLLTAHHLHPPATHPLAALLHNVSSRWFLNRVDSIIFGVFPSKHTCKLWLIKSTSMFEYNSNYDCVYWVVVILVVKPCPVYYQRAQELSWFASWNTDIWMTMSACYKLSELLQPDDFPKNEKSKTISFQNIRKL